MKKLIFGSLLLLLVPSLVIAGPLGLTLRVGPVWRDVQESKLVVSGPVCRRVYSLDEKTALKNDFAATIAPSIHIFEGLSIVGSATRYVEAEQNEYAAQFEYRWGSCRKAVPVAHIDYNQEHRDRLARQEREQLHQEHRLMLENQEKQRQQLNDLQARPVPKPCETVIVAPQKSKCPPKCKHRRRSK